MFEFAGTVAQDIYLQSVQVNQRAIFVQGQSRQPDCGSLGPGTRLKAEQLSKTDLLCAATGGARVHGRRASAPVNATSLVADRAEVLKSLSGGRVAPEEAAMSSHQTFNPPAFEFHPELGYLCPSRQLRQNVRVGLAAAAFGIITGAAGAIVLLPRHGGDLARAETALAVAPPGPVRGSVPLTASSPSAALPAAPAGTAERAVSADGNVKQPPPAAPMSPVTGAANAAPPAVETPAVAPAVTADRGTAAVSGSEQSGPVAKKKTKTGSSSARRRVRKPNPPAAAFATSPFGFQASPYSDGTRSGRRRDWGGGWSW